MKTNQILLIAFFGIGISIIAALVVMYPPVPKTIGIDINPAPENIGTFDYEVKKGDTIFGSQYQIFGGEANEILYDKDSNSLIVLFEESEKGYIQIIIPIGLLHSVDQSPFTYFVMVDGEEVTFEQLSPIILKIQFEEGTKQIEIIGTSRI